MIVKVTQEHIANGDRCSRYSCPVALALKDAGFPNPQVWRHAWESDTSDETRYQKKVKEFIDRFDNREPVKPFSFRTRSPKQVPHE